MPIKDADYNKAKGILKKAGSKTADKTHTSHTGGQDRPDGHGQTLIDDCTKEFQAADKKLDKSKKPKGDMSEVHFKAIQDAKKALGLR